MLLKIEAYMLPCFNKKLFGIDCPGCGTQRAIAHLFKGDFAAAFEVYPAIYTLLLLVVFLTFNTFYRFKYDTILKIICIAIHVLTVGISYIIKMNHDI